VVLGWRWLQRQPKQAGIPWPFRRGLEANAALWQSLSSNQRLAPVYPRSAAARVPRVNGKLGLDREADPAAWRLLVEGVHGAAAPLSLTLAAVQALPRHELTTELRCVEGWSIVVTWGGARLADFMAAYPPAARGGAGPADVRRHPERAPRFLALETPGRGYYVGLDLASALHPQTLLAYELNGAPLSWDHGAPLRLAIPIKYGVKSLKRLGTLRYTDVQPADYWAERGYDWYLGH
jgi:DMSO/TMAO reductase YedYZ molybdopterin-dependent catalytic subunit